MSLQTLLAFDVFETELAEVYDGLLGEFLRVGGEVPWPHPVATQLHHLDVLHPGDDVIRPVACAAAGWVLVHAPRSRGRRGTCRARKRGGAALCRLGLRKIWTKVTPL